jgi:hypothetical protein
MNKRKKKRTKGLQEKILASLWFKKNDIFSVAEDKNKLKKNLKQYLLFKNKYIMVINYKYLKVAASNKTSNGYAFQFKTSAYLFQVFFELLE